MTLALTNHLLSKQNHNNILNELYNISHDLFWYQSSSKTHTSSLCPLKWSNPQTTSILKNLSHVSSNLRPSHVVSPFDNNSYLISINTTPQIFIKLAPQTIIHGTFHVVFVRYDLMGFINGFKPCHSWSINGND